MIETHGVTRRYDEAVVVDGVSVTLPRRALTAIIGPNGAGKSTLLSMISRLLAMDAGSVTVDGMDVTGTPGDMLARRLSILRQDNQISSRLKVRELVAFGRYPHTRGRPTIEDQAHIEQALAYLGLEPFAERFLDELSGGQRQRAFVAMVLCQDTDYVLLDEPLNNLDLKHAVAMMRLLRRAVDELGKTIVVVLHDINFAAAHADHIVAMKDGRLAHQGPPKALVTPAILEALYEIEVDVTTIHGHPVALYFRPPAR